MEGKNQVGELIVDQLENDERAAGSEHQLNEWLSSEENNAEMDKYRRIWRGTEHAKTIQQFDSASAWHTVDLAINNRTGRLRKINQVVYLISGMAASMIILLILNFFTGFFSFSEAKLTASTSYGSRSELVLPDGTQVKLNAGSSLEYRYDKIRQIRNVIFSGEGFFEVSKSTKPFVIHTPDGLDVKVLGTKFNLRTYPDDRISQTSLLEGRVEISHPGTDRLILNPGQIVSYDKKENSLKTTNDEISHKIGWMQNKLYLDNMSLAEVCKRLERWYDVKITLKDKAMGETIHYSGVLMEQSVTDVLNALCRLSSINYELKGKNVVIASN